jgi:hypothetical protein
MEDITSNLRTFLLDETTMDGTDGTTSLIEGAFGDRIHVNFVPDETTYPYALIRRVTESSLHTLSERYGTEAIIQIDVYDDDLDDCITNAYLIETELAGYSGAVKDIGKCLVFTNNISDAWMPDTRAFRCIIQADIKRTL